MANGGKTSRPKGSRARRTKDPAVEQRVAELMARHGLGRPQAIQVAQGRAELTTLLKRMALDVEVESLMRRHGLARALATQVAMGQADLQVVLSKRRMAAHLEAHRGRSLLDEAMASGASLLLGLHGQVQEEAKVLAVDRFEVELAPRTGEARRVHKLELKWGCLADAGKKVRRAIRQDPALKAAPRGPIEKPQDRYTCSNRRLHGLMDAGTPVAVTLLEGEQLRGQLTWISRYELGLALKGNVEVVIFRHALADLNPA